MQDLARHTLSVPLLRVDATAIDGIYGGQSGQHPVEQAPCAAVATLTLGLLDEERGQREDVGLVFQKLDIVMVKR